MDRKGTIYARDFQAFLASPHAAPVSSEPNRAFWADFTQRSEMINGFLATGGGSADSAPDFVDLLIYNKSRDTHRVCPHCRQAYTARAREGTSPDVQAEQKLSGICSWGCYNSLTGGQMKEVFGGAGR